MRAMDRFTDRVLTSILTLAVILLSEFRPLSAGLITVDFSGTIIVGGSAPADGFSASAGDSFSGTFTYNTLNENDPAAVISITDGLSVISNQPINTFTYFRNTVTSQFIGSSELPTGTFIGVDLDYSAPHTSTPLPDPFVPSDFSDGIIFIDNINSPFFINGNITSMQVQPTGPEVTSTPEPASLTLCGLGVFWSALVLKFRKRTGFSEVSKP